MLSIIIFCLFYQLLPWCPVKSFVTYLRNLSLKINTFISENTVMKNRNSTEQGQKAVRVTERGQLFAIHCSHTDVQATVWDRKSHAGTE